ncbi:cell division protein ZapB [Spirochaeta dissipatitropha]
MIQLEQIQRLQERVLAAVKKIDTLQQENSRMQERAEMAENRAAELQDQIDAHSTKYAQIEEGILHALSHLDSLEDAVAQASKPVQAGGAEEGIVIEEEADQTDPPAAEAPDSSNEEHEEAKAEVQDSDEQQTEVTDYYEEEPAHQPEAELDIF